MIRVCLYIGLQGIARMVSELIAVRYLLESKVKSTTLLKSRYVLYKYNDFSFFDKLILTCLRYLIDFKLGMMIATP